MSRRLREKKRPLALTWDADALPANAKTGAAVASPPPKKLAKRSYATESFDDMLGSKAESAKLSTSPEGAAAVMAEGQAAKASIMGTSSSCKKMSSSAPPPPSKSSDIYFIPPSLA